MPADSQPDSARSPRSVEHHRQRLGLLHGAPGEGGVGRRADQPPRREADQCVPDEAVDAVPERVFLVQPAAQVPGLLVEDEGTPAGATMSVRPAARLPATTARRATALCW